VNDDELATRLSYFLWSSLPDAELLETAATGRLHEPEILLAQTRRMLRDGKLRNRTLVSTVMSNLGLERAIEAAGGRMVRTAVGDRDHPSGLRAARHVLGLGRRDHDLAE
jgi:phosphomannomutase